MSCTPNPLAMQSGERLDRPVTMPVSPLAKLDIEDAIVQWLERFHVEQWSGSLTLHFNRGILQSYEPKPNLRIAVK